MSPRSSSPVPALIGLNVIGLGVICLLTCALATGHAQDSSAVRFGRWDVTTLFRISKSQNDNQVHYGLRLDSNCNPVGDAPVFAYWRLLEEKPTRLAPLLSHEQSAYGLQSPQTVFRLHDKSRVRFSLRAFPDRPLVAVVQKRDDRCTATVQTRITKVNAVLNRIHVVLGFLWSVQRIEIEGRSLIDGSPVREVIDR